MWLLLEEIRLPCLLVDLYLLRGPGEKSLQAGDGLAVVEVLGHVLPADAEVPVPEVGGIELRVHRQETPWNPAEFHPLAAIAGGGSKTPLRFIPMALARAEMVELVGRVYPSRNLSTVCLLTLANDARVARSMPRIRMSSLRVFVVS
jgi:hypothetical protein